MATRVLIADASAARREELRLVLRRADLDVCTEATNAAGAVAGATREQPDVCLLDVHIPGSGIAAAREITTRLPEAKVVLLTSSDDDDDELFAALHAGAHGYLPRPRDLHKVAPAIHGVLRGEIALPRSLVQLLVDRFRDRGSLRRHLTDNAREQLTAREWQVLDLLGQELSTAEIAERLVLAPATVRSHVAAVAHKLHLGGREDLLRAFSEE